MSSIPKFTINELIEAGAHFGHKTMRWNPKMAPYIYDERNGIHIIDLQKTAPMLHNGLKAINEVARNNGRVLFVGTKRQASGIIAEAAKRCGQYFINHRWLGGMLTNWETVSQSIKTLKEIEAKIQSDNDSFTKLTKKEKLDLVRKADKLDKYLGGISEMGGVPNILFVIDTNKEHIAVKEAKRLSIPVVGIVDSNANPEDVDFAIPGNDDATRSIKLYCKLVSDAILNGIQESLVASGADLGSSEKGVDMHSFKKKSGDNLSGDRKKSASLKNVKVSALDFASEEPALDNVEESSPKSAENDNKEEEVKKAKAASKKEVEKKSVAIKDEAPVEKKAAPKKAVKPKSTKVEKH